MVPRNPTVERDPHKGTEPAPPRDVYGWDWSQTTHDPRGTAHTVRDALETLVAGLKGHTVVPGKGVQGWERSVEVYDDEGYRLGQVYYGGKRTDLHVVSTSGAADRTRWGVACLYGAKTSRVDTRVDTLLSFDDLEAVARDAAGLKARVTYMATEQGGRSQGRTIYVGSPSSMVRLRIYEKWLESPGQYEDGTNRVEVQLRPPSRGKCVVSEWTPEETFCASQLSRRVAALLGTELAKPGTLQKSKGTPDLERTLAAMGRQYGPGVVRWLEASGGDIGRVLDYVAPGTVARSGEALRREGDA